MSESEQLQKVLEENRQLRETGNELCMAVIRIATTYDGVHRGLLAASNWLKALANEGGRGETNE